MAGVYFNAVPRPEPSAHSARSTDSRSQSSLAHLITQTHIFVDALLETARLHGHLRLGGVAQRVGAHDGRDGVAEQLDVVDGVAGHHGLVQVRVEGHLLHVLVRAHLHKRLARGVGAVENLLQDVEIDYYL